MEHSFTEKPFFHKYNLSNKLKDSINLYSKLLNEIKSNNDFFSKDLKKNIFLYGNKKIKNFFLIHTLINDKISVLKIEKTLHKISNTLAPKFPVTGNDLLKQGVKNGKKIGDILKEIQKKWIENDFKINNEDIKVVLKKNI